MQWFCYVCNGFVMSAKDWLYVNGLVICVKGFAACQWILSLCNDDTSFYLGINDDALFHHVSEVVGNDETSIILFAFWCHIVVFFFFVLHLVIAFRQIIYRNNSVVFVGDNRFLVQAGTCQFLILGNSQLHSMADSLTSYGRHILK